MYLTLDLLKEASSAGGPSTLTSTTELVAAAGPHASVAPAKFAARGREGGTYAYETRYLAGEPATAVVIDSKQSQLNRAEGGLVAAIEEGHQVLSRLPRVQVTYQRGETTEIYSDLTLPHRVFDGHVRAGEIDGVPVTQVPAYRSVRDAAPANARALLDVSPASLIFGGWDSSRASRQGRWRSLLVGEIIGFCVDDNLSMKGGGRADPVGMNFEKVDQKVLAQLARAQQDELSPKLFAKVTAPSSKEKSSSLGLGGIAPNLETLAGVACRRIIRSHVLSFAGLRQIRFGAGTQGDAACRALLAALALNALARSDAELSLRANCDLREAGPTVVELDRRGGETLSLTPLSIAAADDLLAEALADATASAGVEWTGVALRVTGNPLVLAGAADDDSTN